MKPENHAIRDLEKELAIAPTEIADAIGRVILGLKAVLLNKGDDDALKLALRALAQDVAALEEIKRRA